MGFIVGAVIGAGAAIVGGAMASKGARDAAKTAAAGGDRSIEFQRESRDLAREDQAPYREAGYRALSALESMTGIGVPASSAGGRMRGGPRQNPRIGRPRGRGGRFARKENNLLSGLGPGGSRRSAYERNSAFNALYAGGPMDKSKMYNVHELGPENIYAGGAVTRGKGPATIDGQTGYVEPNIEGRYAGGMTGQWGAPVMQNYMQNNDIGPGATGFRDPWTPGTQMPNRTPGPGVPGPDDDLGGGRTWRTGGPLGPTPIGGNGNYPRENPGGQEGGYNFMTEPGYQFRFEEGQRALDRGAAASGGLLSGGYGRKAIRYGQGFASQEYSNVYNRIASIAGLGQTSATTSGNAALYAGQGMGNAASNAGNATAYGQIGAGNAWANAGNQIAQMPWDKFNWGGTAVNPVSGGSGSYAGGSRSDRRLKRNIERIGTVKGYPWYSFEYLWGEKSEGVMSDEVPEKYVFKDDDGYDVVKYHELLGT